MIIGILVLTVLASLFSGAGRANTAVNNARRHAENYLDTDYTTDPSEREPARARYRGREILTIAKFDMVLLFTIVADMVLKPTVNDWLTLAIMAPDHGSALASGSGAMIAGSGVLGSNG